jgi:hypothetical protein
MLEQIIPTIIVLFLCSMICERIADFLKHYLNQSKFWHIGDTLTKFASNEKLEGERYFRILKINFLCGFITALIFKADMIMILRNPKNVQNTIGWQHIEKYYFGIDYFLLIFGIALTALFISFGSKFWHDLLDILLQIKNYKRILTDAETMKIDKIATLEERPLIFQSDYIQGAFLEAKRTLLNPDIRAICLMHNANGYYFEVSVIRPGVTVPASFVYTPSKGGPVTIPVVMVVISDEIIPHALNLGSKISNKNTPGNTGTLGCLVKKKGSNSADRFILTCFHSVVEAGKGFTFSHSQDTIEVLSPNSSGKPLGKAVEAERNAVVDGALIKIEKAQLSLFQNSIPGGRGRPLGERTVNNTDVENNVVVKMYGAESGGTAGKVISVFADVSIKYSDGLHTLYNLMAITNNGTAISQPGDSGACVMDADNNLVGILVAGNSSVSYAIPASAMLGHFNVEIITT